MPREERKFTKESREKLYRNKIKEYYALLDMKHSLGWIELDKPRRAGFKKYYVLQDHAKNSNIAHRLRKLLDKFTNEVYCSNRNFKYTRDSFFGGHKKGDTIFVKKRFYRASNQSVYDGTWADDFDSDIRKYLYPEQKYSFNGGVYYEVTMDSRYIKQYFREKVAPNWITRVREIDPDLESKIDRVHAFLCKNLVWEKVQGKHTSGWDRADNEKYFRMKYESEMEVEND